MLSGSELYPRWVPLKHLQQITNKHYDIPVSQIFFFRWIKTEKSAGLN